MALPGNAWAAVKGLNFSSNGRQRDIFTFLHEIMCFCLSVKWLYSSPDSTKQPAGRIWLDTAVEREAGPGICVSCALQLRCSLV